MVGPVSKYSKWEKLGAEAGPGTKIIKPKLQKLMKYLTPLIMKVR
jgi:hypothetical protein